MIHSIVPVALARSIFRCLYHLPSLRHTPFFRTSVAERTFLLVPGFGDRDGVKGRDGCADEDENPGLSQTSDPAAS